MALDEEGTRAALGERAGKLFLALARSGAPRHLEELAPKLDEYLGFLEDTLALEAYRELRRDYPLNQARELAEAWRALLREAAGGDETTRLLVATGVRYFVTPHDADSELESRDGFRDDREVLAFVRRSAGLREP